jgi:hypothetical protein
VTIDDDDDDDDDGDDINSNGTTRTTHELTLSHALPQAASSSSWNLSPYWRLINCFHAISASSAILNTSQKVQVSCHLLLILKRITIIITIIALILIQTTLTTLH